MPAGNHFTPVRLRDIDASVLRASLDYLYTASPQINDVISFLFDDAASRQEDNITATERLAQVSGAYTATLPSFLRYMHYQGSAFCMAQ